MTAPRYLVLDSRLPGEASALAATLPAATNLSLVATTAHLAILAGRPELYVPFETGEGGFIGHIFSREEQPTRREAISRPATHSIVSTKGSAALKTLWGAYLLVCEDPHHETITVARDPSGILPCLTVECGTLTIFASDIQTLVASGLFDPVIDEALLLRHMTYIDLCVPETCLRGLTELLPGMRYERRGAAQANSPWWSPWDFACEPTLTTGDELASALRNTITGCAAAWASCFDRGLVSLSGGLDSSIVTAALAPHISNLSAFTLVGDDADGDERAYARLVARHFKTDMSEIDYDVAVIDLTKPSAPYLPRPTAIAAMQALTAATRMVASREPYDAHFSGLGGDNIFCWMSSALAVADSVRAGRSINATVSTARDVAKIAEVSLVSVLLQTGRMLVRGRRPLRTDGVGNYLSPEARARMAPRAIPSWIQRPKHVAMGRAYHVEMLARMQPFLESSDRLRDPVVLPILFSQPILELCLKIPSWEWVSGGQNRSTARSAFLPVLPQQIVARRSKGGPDTLHLALCLAQLDLLREMLLHGELASRKMIDRHEVDKALTRASLVRSGGYHEILILAEVEAWIRYWTDPTTTVSLRGGAVET